MLREEGYYVIAKSDGDVIAGPMDTKDQAIKYCNEVDSTRSTFIPARYFNGQWYKVEK
ncbi:hypothetical protein [Ralstonia phage RP13]|nr:hypothetical protein [Ralstonia phage RP13]